MLSVEEIADLLRSQDKLNKKKIDMYIATIEDNNINGQVLLTCDLKELKETMNMSFGDWELFRILILTLRDHEIDNLLTGHKTEDRVVSCSASAPPKQTASFKIAGNSSPDLKVSDTLTTKISKSSSDLIETSSGSAKAKSTILEKQVFRFII